MSTRSQINKINIPSNIWIFMGGDITCKRGKLKLAKYNDKTANISVANIFIDEGEFVIKYNDYEIESELLKYDFSKSGHTDNYWKKHGLEFVALEKLEKDVNHTRLEDTFEESIYFVTRGDFSFNFNGNLVSFSSLFSKFKEYLETKKDYGSFYGNGSFHEFFKMKITSDNPEIEEKIILDNYEFLVWHLTFYLREYHDLTTRFFIPIKESNPPFNLDKDRRDFTRKSFEHEIIGDHRDAPNVFYQSRFMAIKNTCR